jgi:ABC-2 type transport system permease protein
MWNIAAREWRILFLSPLAWSILAVVEFILAYVFLSRTEYFMQIQTQLTGIPDAPGFTQLIVGATFGTAGIVLLLVTPLLTMRVISEERRNRTLTLLLSAPISMPAIVMGKFLGLMGFFVVLISLLALMPLTLLTGGALDWGRFASALLGLLLLCAAFSAVGLYLSTLTSHPTVAAVSTFGILLLLWIIDMAGQGADQESLFAYLSLTQHYEALLKGVFNTKDVVYYLLVTGVFLVLSMKQLDSERYR